MFRLLVILFLLAICVRNNSNKHYWKTKCIESQIWADTLYEETIRLSDTIAALRNDNYLLKQYLSEVKDTSITNVKISR